MTTMTTETPDTYNGWTNRETWAVALYINNDQGWQEQIHEALREATITRHGGFAGDFTSEDVKLTDAAQNPDTRLMAQRNAGELIRENVETLLNPLSYRDEYGEQQPEALTSALWDIGSVYRVDWDELGAAFLTDVSEEMDVD